MASNENFCNISNCIFNNLLTNIRGSACHCDSISYQALLSFCTFRECKSTAVGLSQVRRDQLGGGGACFFDVFKLDAFYCIFYLCESAGLGSAIYSSAPIEQAFEIYCLSDFLCGTPGSTEEQTIYAIEGASPQINSINSSYSYQINRHGLIHFGKYPYSIHFQFYCVIFKEINGAPLGLSSFDNEHESHNNYHVYINCSNSNAIITAWKGIHYFENVTFYNCIGNLIKNYETPALFYFKYCSFDSRITNINDYQLTECNTNPFIEFTQFNCITNNKIIKTFNNNDLNDLLIKLLTSSFFLFRS